MMDLTDLYEAQKALDANIAKNHNISYESTRNKRILALLVELGEFANTTRCFKFWSLKGPEEKAVILDEYADGLHFLLSLGLDLKVKKMKYNITKREDNLTDQILKTYTKVALFDKKRDEASYIKAFQSFLNIIPFLGVKFVTIKKAYFTKLDVNFQRQKNNY